MSKRITRADIPARADTGLEQLLDAVEPVIDLLAHEPQRFTVRRTRFTAEREPIPPSVRAWVFRRDGNRCVWCGSANRLQLDHIVPWSHGGDENLDNLRTLCGDCNGLRSNFGQFLDLTVRPVPHGWGCVRCLNHIGEYAAEFDLPISLIYCMYCEMKALGFAHGVGPQAQPDAGAPADTSAADQADDEAVAL